MKSIAAKKRARLRPDSPDEENPEWTDADFARSKSLDHFPELARLVRGRGERGPQKAPTKQQVTLRLDRDVVNRFRSTGPGWQSRINDALKKARLG
jgi:uncharacterized protein (DUF4415 family)